MPRKGENFYRANRRALFFNLGICPYCKKVKLEGEQTACDGCRQKQKERNAKYRRECKELALKHREEERHAAVESRM